MELLANGEKPAGVALADDPTPRGCALALLMDELAHGVLVTTLQGRLLHANQLAHRELARKRVLDVHQGVVRACAPADARILHEALARAGEGKRGLIGLHAAEGVLVCLAVVPLIAQEPGKPPKAALLFARTSVCEEPMLGFFARRHALTATEEHVLRILCQGFSTPQIAARMDVAVSTVRSHVRSLCAKTRSNGVRELVNRVAVLPPVAPAFRYPAVH